MAQTVKEVGHEGKRFTFATPSQTHPLMMVLGRGGKGNERAKRLVGQTEAVEEACLHFVVLKMCQEQ